MACESASSRSRLPSGDLAHQALVRARSRSLDGTDPARQSRRALAPAGAHGNVRNDPCHLAWQVSEIPWLASIRFSREEACRLARQVNQILTLRILRAGQVAGLLECRRI